MRETAKDIARRKGISENDDILDYMGSEELGANFISNCANGC